MTQEQPQMDMESMLINKALEDEVFKRQLMSNPKATIEKEMGEKLPEGLEIEVLEQQPEKLYLVLPLNIKLEESSSDDLSDEELEAVAGGSLFPIKTFAPFLCGFVTKLVCPTKFIICRRPF